jgi:prepilin signal peptidase PulO-like enzyme (type II secretory pathway)
VELSTAILTVVVFNYFAAVFSLLVVGYYLLIVYCLIAVFVSDLRYQTIPDEISLVAVLAVLLYSLRLGDFWGLVLAGLVSAGFFLFLHLATRGRGMAMGDVKLVFWLGLFLGGRGVLVCVYLAFLTGALFGLILILLGKKKFGERIAFGPFLVLAAAASFFWGERLISAYFNLMGV